MIYRVRISPAVGGMSQDMIRFSYMQDFSYGIIPFVIKHNETLFLLIKHQKGHWAFPKGHKNGNESDVETAIRELKEETGVTPAEIIEKHPFFEQYTYQDPVKGQIEKTVAFYLGRVEDQSVRIQPEEVADYGWFTLAEATEKMTFEAGKEILNQAWQYLHET